MSDDAIITDPMERLLADAMRRAGIAFQHDGERGADTRALDFYLPDANVYIEVKRLHSPRISAQMERADNVIAVQGKGAVEWLALLLNDNYELTRELRETIKCLVREREARALEGAAR